MGWIKVSIDETCHASWKVRQRGSERHLHAIGDGVAGNRVTDELAKLRFDAGRCQTVWLPVLFPDRAITPGQRSINCVTAAGSALLRGWIYIG